MAKVVKFPIERTNAKTSSPRSGKADVVIFPGVRIERREFNLSDRHASRTPALTGKAKLKDI